MEKKPKASPRARATASPAKKSTTTKSTAAPRKRKVSTQVIALGASTGGPPALVEVLNNGVAISNEYLSVSPAAPGVFTSTANGQGQAIALNQDFTPNSSARPEARNRFVIVFANGQGGELINGATQQTINASSGTAAPGSPLYLTKTLPTVTVGGIPANVAFSGLAPGLVGLWQLNVQIPANAPTGASVPLVITSGGRSSSVTTIAVN